MDNDLNNAVLTVPLKSVWSLNWWKENLMVLTVLNHICGGTNQLSCKNNCKIIDGENQLPHK